MRAQHSAITAALATIRNALEDFCPNRILMPIQALTLAPTPIPMRSTCHPCSCPTSLLFPSTVPDTVVPLYQYVTYAPFTMATISGWQGKPVGAETGTLIPMPRLPLTCSPIQPYTSLYSPIDDLTGPISPTLINSLVVLNLARSPSPSPTPTPTPHSHDQEHQGLVIAVGRDYGPAAMQALYTQRSELSEELRELTEQLQQLKEESTFLILDPGLDPGLYMAYTPPPLYHPQCSPILDPGLGLGLGLSGLELWPSLDQVPSPNCCSELPKVGSRQLPYDQVV